MVRVLSFFFQNAFLVMILRFLDGHKSLCYTYLLYNFTGIKNSLLLFFDPSGYLMSSWFNIELKKNPLLCMALQIYYV